MKYIVLKDFEDLTNGHVYRKGDKFPFKGRVKKARIEELSSINNRLGEILIKAVIEDDGYE